MHEHTEMLAKIKDNFEQVVDDVNEYDDRYLIVRGEEVVAVVISYEDYEQFMKLSS